MSVSEAQKKASIKYLEKLDEIRIRMPKGHKEAIKAHAEAHSESVNGFINRAIEETMGRDTEAKNSYRSNHRVETSRTSADLHIARLKGETLPKGKGQSKEQRELNKTIEAVVSAMYDTDRVVEHTADDLIEDLTAIINDFTGKAKRSLQNHSTILQDENARERATAALSEAETAIDAMKETMQRDNAASGASKAPVCGNKEE